MNRPSKLNSERSPFFISKFRSTTFLGEKENLKERDFTSFLLASVGIKEEEFISTTYALDTLTISAPIKSSNERIMLGACGQ